MSDALIKYNDYLVPVSGTGPTPYISLSDQVLIFGDRWGLQHQITLNGVITGSSYSGLYSAQTGLLDIFSKSYKTLDIYEGADDASGFSGANSFSKIFSFSGCSIENISFNESPYFKVVNYTVELTSYPSGLTGYFSGTYGVIDPKDEISISEAEDGFATLNRTISARGIVTTSIDSAINNVKNYVASRTGISYISSINQISGFQNSGSFTPVLIETSENLDRLGLNYSVDQVYKFKMITGDAEAKNNYSFNNYYLTSYSTSLTSGAGDDFVTATVQGEIKAGITGATGDALISGLLSQLSSLDPYKIISGKYGSPNSFNFCRDPLSFSVSQDLKSRKINFNASYDNLEFYNSINDKYCYSGCYLDAVITHSIDELNKITTIGVKGEIKCRGSTANRYYNSLEYLGLLMKAGSSASEPRIFDFANDYYTSYLGTSTPTLALNSNPVSITIDNNPIVGTISVDAIFDNKDRFLNLVTSDYNISYEPYNTIFSYASSCNDSTKHLAVDVNVQKREKVSIDMKINGSGKTEQTLFNNIKALIEPDDSSSFYNNFVIPLSISDSIQEEASSFSVENSSSKNSLTINQYGATIGLSKVYSFELKDSEKSSRRIIKSVSPTKPSNPSLLI